MSVAFQVVDHIVEEVGGSRLMLAHGYARNQAAAELQRELAYELVNHGWSLRHVLQRIVTARQYNRLPPGASTDFAGIDAYVLQPVARPFDQQKPDDPGDPNADTDIRQDAASLGESVHRLSVVQLTEKVHHALGWPSSWTPGADVDPLVAGTLDVFPQPSMLDGLGRYASDREPGWKEPVLPTLAAWETAMGTCEKPHRAVLDPQIHLQSAPSNPVYAGRWGYYEWTDYVDVLVDQAVHQQLPVSTTAALLRERLLQSPVMSHDEQLAFDDLATTLGVLSTQPVSPAQASTLDTVLREYCGALVTSPQFVLGGISTDDAQAALAAASQLPARPAFQTPTPVADGAPMEEPRGYAEWCEDYDYAPNPDGRCGHRVAVQHPGELTPM